MHNEIIAGKRCALRRSKTTDGCVNDPGVLLLDCVIIQTETLEAAGLEIFDEDIGASSKFVG